MRKLTAKRLATKAVDRCARNPQPVPQSDATVGMDRDGTYYLASSAGVKTITGMDREQVIALIVEMLVGGY